jgi:hypothetical protein
MSSKANKRTSGRFLRLLEGSSGNTSRAQQADSGTSVLGHPAARVGHGFLEKRG